VDALKRTIDYLLDYLHTPCYVLGVDAQGQPRAFVKIVPTTSSPVIRDALLASVQAPTGLYAGNPLDQDRSKIEAVLKKPFRLMQCIVKPLGNEDKTFSKEYKQLFSDTKGLPPGLYVFNLSDAVLLREDGQFPFPVPGVQLDKRFRDQTFLPIFSTSGQEGYADLPIPTYDDLELTPSDNEPTDWLAKKDAAVFRGSPTGCGRSTATNSRLRIASMAGGLSYKDRVDAGIVLPGKAAGSPIESQSIHLDPKDGLGYLAPSPEMRTVAFMSPEEQAQFRYILHIDGNVLAYRLTKSLLSDSVVLRVESPYRSWLDEAAGLQAGVHYVAIRRDFSNLLEEMDRLNAAPDKATRMIAAAHRAVQKAIGTSWPETMRKRIVEALQGVSRRRRIQRVAAVAPADKGPCQPLAKGPDANQETLRNLIATAQGLPSPQQSVEQLSAAAYNSVRAAFTPANEAFSPANPASTNQPPVGPSTKRVAKTVRKTVSKTVEKEPTKRRSKKTVPATVQPEVATLSSPVPIELPQASSIDVKQTSSKTSSLPVPQESSTTQSSSTAVPQTSSIELKQASSIDVPPQTKQPSVRKQRTPSKRVKEPLPIPQKRLSPIPEETGSRSPSLQGKPKTVRRTKKVVAEGQGEEAVPSKRATSKKKTATVVEGAEEPVQKPASKRSTKKTATAVEGAEEPVPKPASKRATSKKKTALEEQVPPS